MGILIIKVLATWSLVALVMGLGLGPPFAEPSVSAEKSS